MDPGSRSWRNCLTLGHARYLESDTCFEICDKKVTTGNGKILSFDSFPIWLSGRVVGGKMRYSKRYKEENNGLEMVARKLFLLLLN